MSIAPVTFSHKRPSPVHSSTDAYPSPRQSPSMGLNKATMVAVTSAPQWNSEHLPTTSGMQEGGWAATSYDQKPHSPSIHHNHPSGQDSYHCLPSPPHQNYSGMDGDFVATTMSIEPQARHAHTSEQMMLSPEHIGGMTMSMEPSTTAISSPGIMSISDYSSDIGLVDGMGIGDTDTEISRKWRANSDPSVGPYGVTKKMRKRRQFTEPHEANFRCEICGKYFSRIWNYNAHKNTHDPNRLKPHICLMDNCRKQFVRKTDLNRHQQCVHQKLKKFECSLCHNRFARKDTLRRHEDDGCPKRVDIVSRNNRGKPINFNSLAFRFQHPSQEPYRDEQHLNQEYSLRQYPENHSIPYSLPPIAVPKPQISPMHHHQPISAQWS